MPVQKNLIGPKTGIIFFMQNTISYYLIVMIIVMGNMTVVGFLRLLFISYVFFHLVLCINSVTLPTRLCLSDCCSGFC